MCARLMDFEVFAISKKEVVYIPINTSINMKEPFAYRFGADELDLRCVALSAQSSLMTRKSYPIPNLRSRPK